MTKVPLGRNRSVVQLQFSDFFSGQSHLWCKAIRLVDGGAARLSCWLRPGLKLHRSENNTTSDPLSPIGLAVERINTLLREENTALKEMDFGRAGALLQAKYAAAGVLESALRADYPGVLSAESKRQLSSLATENRELLQRAARIQKRVATLVTKVLDIKEE